MTLILGMSKPEGIYLSADFRVTDLRSKTLINDTSVKFLTIHYPPDKTGPKVLLAYSGLATLPDGTPMGTWIRETIRGESEVIDVSMAHLRERLDRDISKLRAPLIINILVSEGERRLYGGLSNLERSGRVLSAFGYVMRELTAPFFFANGSGAAKLAADRQMDVVRAQLDIRPRQPADHMNLLATVNRRVAAADKTVSPFSHVAFIPSDGSNSPDSRTYTQPGESAPFTMPILLFGIDLTELFEDFVEKASAQRKGESVDWAMDSDAVNEQLKRRP